MRIELLSLCQCDCHMMLGDLTTWWREQLAFMYALCIEANVQALLKFKLEDRLFAYLDPNLCNFARAS